MPVIDGDDDTSTETIIGDHHRAVCCGRLCERHPLRLALVLSRRLPPSFAKEPCPCSNRSGVSLLIEIASDGAGSFEEDFDREELHERLRSGRRFEDLDEHSVPQLALSELAASHGPLPNQLRPDCLPTRAHKTRIDKHDDEHRRRPPKPSIEDEHRRRECRRGARSSLRSAILAQCPASMNRCGASRRRRFHGRTTTSIETHR